jgi:hypothetical protein
MAAPILEIMDSGGIRRESDRHFKNEREYLRNKINERATISKNNIRHLYRGIN